MSNQLTFNDFLADHELTAQKEVIIQHPFWWQFLNLLDPQFTVTFDCMDDISGFKETEEFTIKMEQDLLI